jgi:arylsulfatase A-like enzyme
MGIPICKFILLTFLFLNSAPGARAEAPASAKPSKPNILIFLVDDFGARDLSCYGSDFYETPAIDQLAAEGQRYVQAYAAHPRCVPSRYGFFTGRFPVRDGCPGNTYNIAPETRTLAEALKAGGYATFFAGKWHLAKNLDELPDAQGFDINIAGGAAGAPRSYFAPYNQSKNPHHKAAAINGLETAPIGEYLTDRLTDETVLFLKEHAASKSKQPFFAVLAHYAVHTPFEAKAEETHYFQRKLDPQKKEAFTLRDGSTKLEQDNAVYAAMIRSTDESLARVLQTLDELKLANNTLIILTSDHGGLSNRGASSTRPLATSNLPLRAGKGHLYEGGIRVPFIVRWPGVAPAGKTSETIVTGTDLYATCLEAAELEPEPSHHIDSVSILPAIKGKALPRGPIVWHSPRPRPGSTGDTASSALRLEQYKLIKFYFPEEHYELYDLNTDPGENKNLFHSAKALSLKLSHLLHSKLTEMGAVQPVSGQ